MTTTLSDASTSPGVSAPIAATPALSKAPRITSIDAVRGFVMLTMIFVNDFAGTPDDIAPWWMKHYSDMKPAPAVEDGMTFVDMVFPGFLFIVGMSIPFALGGRLARGEKPWRLLPHIVLRTVSLLLLGILMVNGSPTSRLIGYPGHVWSMLMFTAAFLAFCQISPFWVGPTDKGSQKVWRIVTLVVRTAGALGLAYLICTWQKTITNRGTHEEHIVRLFTLHPFSIRHSWYDILGLIGWAYLVGSLLFLVFRTRRLPLAVCVALLLGFWVADQNGSFENFHLPGLLAPIGVAIAWVVSAINGVVDIGGSLGSQAAITVAGVLLATILLTPDTATVASRTRFTLWFIAATAFAAMVFYKPFLVWKNSATPPWCLWACAITGAIWLIFYLLGDVLRWQWLTRPFAIAGQNVLLAYLLSESLDLYLNLAGLSDWYDHLAGSTLTTAIARSLGLGIVLLAFTAGVNRLGFRLRL